MIDLKAKRKEAGMTQEQLAKEAEVIRQTISNIEKGVSKPSIQTAKLLGEILNFKWYEFFED